MGAEEVQTVESFTIKAGDSREETEVVWLKPTATS
jgi:hypothetical protein